MPGLGFVVPLCKKSTYVQPQNKNAHEKFHTVNLLRVDVQYFGNKYMHMYMDGSIDGRFNSYFTYNLELYLFMVQTQTYSQA